MKIDKALSNTMFEKRIICQSCQIGFEAGIYTLWTHDEGATEHRVIGRYCKGCLVEIQGLEIPKEPRFWISESNIKGMFLVWGSEGDAVYVHTGSLASATDKFTKEKAEAICKVANEIWE